MKKDWVEIKAPKYTLTEAEKMGLEYWNEALEIAASIAEDYEFTGLRGREYAIVPAVKELIAKAIRKQKAKIRRTKVKGAANE